MATPRTFPGGQEAADHLWNIASMRRGRALAGGISLVLLLGASAFGSEGVQRSVETRAVGKRIKIGIHAPITGAAPLPTTSIQQGAEVYWRWLEHKGRKINDRNVKVILRNDNTNPSQAVAVCREMVEDNKVLLLFAPLQSNVIGSGQVQACARYANSVGVPYVSPGSSKYLMNSLTNLFMTAEALEDQARAVAKHFATLPGQHGVVYVNTPFGTKAQKAFEKELERRDETVTVAHEVPKTAGASHAQNAVAELKLAGVDNVLELTSSVFLIQLLSAANNVSYEPVWASAGFGGHLSDGTLNVFCNQGGIYDGSFAVSPVPAFKDRNSYDPQHDVAMQALYDKDGDTITWMGWAASQQLHEMLDDAGRDLSRKRFIKVAQRGRYNTPVMPPFAFTPKDRFGGNRSYLLKVNCDARRWSTVKKI